MAQLSSRLLTESDSLKIMHFYHGFDRTPVSVHVCAALAVVMGCTGVSRNSAQNLSLPESRKEQCPASLNLSTASSTASQAMRIPLLSSLQAKSVLRRLSRHGLTSSSRKQKLSLQREKSLSSKSIKYY